MNFCLCIFPTFCLLKAASSYHVLPTHIFGTKLSTQSGNKKNQEMYFSASCSIYDLTGTSVMARPQTILSVTPVHSGIDGDTHLAKPHRSFKQTAALWIQLARFRFLAYSPVEFGLGVAMAQGVTQKASSVIPPLLYAQGVLFVWLKHIMIHYMNEYHDYETDCHNAQSNGWTGGSGVLPRNPDLLGPCCQAGWLTFGLCMFGAMRLGGTLSKALGVAMTVLMWQYSAPPLRLNGGMGVGEPVVGVWLAGMIPLFGYSLAMSCNHSSLSYSASLAKVSVALLPGVVLATARQVMMNVPDVESDVASGKCNLCVRIGPTNGRKVFAFGTLLSYASLWAASLAKMIPCSVAFLQTVFTMPIALKLVVVSLSKNNSNQWLTDSNVPFLASMLRSLFQCMGLIGYTYSCGMKSSIASCERALLLWPVLLFGLASSYGVSAVLAKARTQPHLSILGWRPHFVVETRQT